MGKQIREMREDAGMTQLRLAELSGLTNTYICEIEHDRKRPSIDSLCRILYVFGLYLAYVRENQISETKSAFIITDIFFVEGEDV